MDIRTKLVFALVAVTLGSMAAFGAFMDRTAVRMINEGTEAQLQGLAESSAGALESIADGWEERVLLIASRTQLRLSLREYDASGNPASVARIERILADATLASSVAALAVYDAEGKPVARAGRAADTAPAVMTPQEGAQARDSVVFRGEVFTEDGLPHVAYSARLELDGERVGFLFVLLSAQRLFDLTQDYTGLGEKGEVLIVTPEGAGARTLHPVRHPDAAGERPATILIEAPDDPAFRALAGRDSVYLDGLVDYRGEPVWAATRDLPDTGWGLVVKFDAAEKRTAIERFREELVAVALSLAGLGILVAVVLGFRFAGPIHELAGTANRIREGELAARAPVKREDEIGLLARTFNEMADELEERVMELHEFHTFFEVSMDMMCIAGTDGYFKRTNPAFTDTLGWTAEQLVSRPFYELVHPDDVAATRREIDKLAKGIPTISFVNRFRCVDGTWKWLRWNSYPDPDTRLLYAIARETTSPQAAE